MREKNYNLELVRVISFVFVIVIHVANYFCRAYGSITAPEYVFALGINTVARISVPCFFMISGALLLGRREELKKSWRRAAHFAIVLVIWTVIYYVFNTYYTKQGCDLTKILERPAEAHLWYLYVMIPVYLVLPYLQAMCAGLDEKMEHGFAALGGLWVVILHIMSYTELSWYYDLPIFGDRSYVYYLFMGYYLNKYKEKYWKNWKTSVGIFAAVIVVNVVITAVGSFYIKDHYERTLEYGNPFVMASAFVVFVSIMQLKKGKLHFQEKTKVWIDRCASCSFGIYLIHILFLDVYKIHVPATVYPSFIAIPVLTIIILGVSFFVVYYLRKIPYVKKLL